MKTKKLTIRGEYWIIDGSPNYADGDIGDTNHEGYALNHLRRLVLEAVDIDPGDDYDWDELVKDIPQALNEALDLGLEPIGEGLADMVEAGDVCDELGKFTTQLNLDPEDLEQAFERAGQDVRDYMSRKHGWIICHGNRFGVWHLTRDAAKQIEEAVGDILFEENGLEDGDPDIDAELEIFVASTEKTYEVLWSALTLEDFSALKLTEPVVGPNAQLAAMDRALEHPYYQQSCQPSIK